VFGDAAFPKVVVVYDDVPAGNHAIRVLARMFHEPEDKVALRPRLWRFDFLEDTDWLSMALADAVNADIVVISASSPRGLEPSLANWIELCMARKEGSAAAIVVLFGSPESLDGPASPRLQFVEKAARKAGLDFFAPRPGLNLRSGAALDIGPTLREGSSPAGADRPALS
jgi:hypothetical protein